MAVKNQPDEVDQRFQDLGKEILELRTQLGGVTLLLQEEQKRQNEVNEQIRVGLQSVNEALNKYGKNSNALERRLDLVRSDASSGIILTLSVFAVLFLASFFVRG